MSIRGATRINLRASIIIGLGLAAHHLFISCAAGSAQAAVAGGLPSLNTISQPASPETSQPATIGQPVATTEAEALTSTQYLLGTGDSVQVTVFNAPDYSGTFNVLAGGALNVPLAGEVAVEGLTLQQAADDIATRLAQYVRRPRVTVSLLAARPLQVAIAGQVIRPGSYTIPAITGSADRVPTAQNDAGAAAPTLTQVISLAGGITQSADIRNIKVLRQSSRSEAIASSAGASDKEIDVDLWQLIREGQLDADLPLQRGDRILIPKAAALSPEETTELASASFSPETITVNVVGEVEKPGAIELPPNAPLNQAILTAGGFTRRARKSSVSLIRLNDNGTVAKQKVDINFESGVDPSSNPPLRPNDTVVVGTNGLNQVTDTLGTVLSPLNSGFGLFRLFGL